MAVAEERKVMLVVLGFVLDWRSVRTDVFLAFLAYLPAPVVLGLAIGTRNPSMPMIVPSDMARSGLAVLADLMMVAASFTVGWFHNAL